MKHPFERLSDTLIRPLFLVLISLTILLMVVMNLAGAPLQTPVAPYGIVSFELAGKAESSIKIIASWDNYARQMAAFSLGLDYLFMVLYSTTIGLGCIWAGRALADRQIRLAYLGAPLGWGQWAGAGFDALENLALILILSGGNAQMWAPLARWCAIIKFILVFLGIAYAFLGLVISIGLKPKPR